MKGSRYLVHCCLGAGITLLFMVCVGLRTGVNQQYFEWLRAPADYAQALLNGSGPLRIILGFDNIFIALYSSALILLVQALRNPANRRILNLVLLAGLAGGLLDYIENLHIFSMLTAAQQGLPLSASEIELQMVGSMLKWHLAYFAFFLLAFALHPRNLLERLFQGSLLFVQLPVGVFYYLLADSAWGQLLFFGRYANLLVGFLLLAWMFHRRRQRMERDQALASAA